jgi:uncharacterized RDD family membrane protein YckC
MNTLAVRTPEGVEFTMPLAGPVTRFLAWLVDALAISVLWGIISAGISWMQLISGGLLFAVSIVLYFVVSIGYGIVLEWFWRGQTFGKRMFRLRVLDADGLRLQPSQIIVRNLLRFVDSLPALYLVGGIACVASRRHQRLGDLAANTVVVHQPQLAHPDLEQLLAGKFNSFRAHAHLAARLRQRVSPAEASVALQALLRRDELDASARVELFAELAGRFRAKVEFPAEATDGLSDEQYVRNVVDVVFREKPAPR